MLIISQTARISRLADIEDSTKGSKIVIEDGVIIDSFVKIKPAGGIGDLIIGSNTVINPGVVIYTGNGISIGKNCLIAANCVFSPTSHEFRSRDQLIMEQGFVSPSPLFVGKTGIVIEDDVWIGANCVILEGAYIQTGAVISAGSIVKGKLDQYGIYSGIPSELYGYRK
ncbi:DapH/DapD/GlmU-related protein [Propionivibrio sp.]|uniref:acyltransferase n=1 Tax=Propionivibrio sp. TaxID=2212460 RepID=UPI002623FE90|nr:DapH/DapD/GlmU-related protein [Propionivibrio sp.]